MGKVEREPESRGGPLAAPPPPPPPPGHPSEAGKGETRSMGWDRSVHNGVSSGEWPGPENWTSRP